MELRSVGWKATNTKAVFSSGLTSKDPRDSCGSDCHSKLVKAIINVEVIGTWENKI